MIAAPFRLAGLALALAAAWPSLPRAIAEPAAGGAARLETKPFDDSRFFPLGVWLQNPRNAARYRSAGINTYIGLWKGPTAEQLRRLKRAGMWVIAQQTDLALTHPDRDIIIGWLQRDEPDNAQRRTLGLGYGPPLAPARVIEDYQALRRRDLTRPVLLNLGQGVAWDRWHGRGSRTNHPEDYRDYILGGDIVSFDIYPVTHPNPAVRGRLEFIARGVSRLKRWSGGRKVVWNVIGASRIKNAAVKPTPAQLRSQAWMGLIHGSTGIIYFVHQFKPRFIEAAVLHDPPMLAALTRLNRTIARLAPVLNGPTVKGLVRAESKPADVPVATMVKRHGGRTYLFAIAMRDRAATVTFKLAGQGRLAGHGRARVRVIGENRRIDAKDAPDGAVFTDRFGPYGVHLYRY